MAATDSARLKGLRFGLVVGGAFLLVAVVSRWRGHELPSAFLGAIGIALVAGGLLIPRQMLPVERAWLQFGHALSRVTTPIILAVLYFGVFTPAGVIRRSISRNPLKHHAEAGGYWKHRPPGKRRSASMERQF